MFKKNELRPIVLAVLLLFTFLTLPQYTSEASADDGSLTLNLLADSTVSKQNITSQIGDLILENNDIVVVRDAQLNLKGNLVMSGNSLLILDNSTLYPDFEKGQYSYKLHDSAKIVMQNNSNIESLIFDFILYDNASIDIVDSVVNQNIRLDSANATLHAVNSYIRVASIYGDSSFINSTSSELNFYGNARIVNSHIEQFEVSSLYHPIYVDLVNSTYGRVNTDFIGQGVIRVYWYLTVLVDSQGAPLQNASVQAVSIADNTVRQQTTTSVTGKAEFELPAIEISEQGQRNIGDYTITVTHGQSQAQENVNLTSSTQKTVSLSMTSTTMIYTFAGIAAATLIIILIIIIYRKKHRSH